MRFNIRKRTQAKLTKILHMTLNPSLLLNSFKTI
jgi:hypothetical protein